MSELKRTPLNAAHYALKAKMVDFGGWDMPVQYAGIKDEHNMVRTKAGLFDVSHMGEVFIKGPDAEKFIQKMVSSDISNMADGQVKYGVLCYPDGNAVDDLLVYKMADCDYLLVVNASNTDKDFAWLEEHAAGYTMSLTNNSAEYAEIAIQGPLAEKILSKVCDIDLAPIKNYYFALGNVCGIACIISRTGYTGEDGFELYYPAADAEKVWNELLAVGGQDICPCGLGCRDTLRFECKMPLYGHELSSTINPLETGLGRFIALEKDFIGRDALAKIKEEGRKRKVIGFEMVGRGVARGGYQVEKDGKIIGEVTTGSYAPSFDKNLGLAIISIEAGIEIDDSFNIIIRDKPVEAKMVKTPFYKRSK
ncbi:MAG: glycine cleavage system aminomethyltransferase GcvT [Clostridia bacterium]